MSCPVCQQKERRAGYAVRGHQLWICDHCQTWYLDEADAQEGAYEGGYLDRAQGDTERHSGYYDYESEFKLHLRNFADNLAILGKYTQGKRLLDVGCASGHFMVAAREGGYDVRGADVSEEGVNQARSRGLDATCGDIRQLDVGDGFDVITLWETIEHIPEPIPVLRHLRGLLGEGGVLAVGTGDTHSPLARALGQRWWYVTPPDHCVYYNPKAMTVALARAGFELVGMERIQRHWVSSRNVIMKLLRSLNIPPGRTLSVARRAPDIPLPIYHSTTMVAVARPR